MSLEGPALNWFNGEVEAEPFGDWRQFKRRLVDRFCGSVEEEPGKRLFGIRQTGLYMITSMSLKSWLA